jgi:CP family cyanate transporter-like MFS transporter
MFLAVALFGLGGPLVSIGGPKLIALWFDQRQRAMAMGIYITGPAIGGIAALSLTNAVMMPWFDHDWRAVLTFYAGITLATGVVWALINLHPMARSVERALAAETKAPQLEIFRALIGLKAVQIVLMMSVGIFFFNHGLNNWMPEILRAGGMTATAAGYWASVPTLVGVAASLTIPRFATQPRRMAILAILFAAAGAAALTLLTVTGPILAAGLVLQGLARATMMTVTLLVLVDIPEIGPKRAGAAGGMFFSAAEIGGVSGPLVMGLLFDTTGGFSAGLTVMTAVTLLLLVLVIPLRRQLKKAAASG